MVTVPTPYDATTGFKLTATDWDAQVRDALLFVMDNYPRCRVYDNTGVACTTNTLLTWSGETYDNDNMHSTSSNTSRLVATTAGLYYVSLTLQFPNNTYTVQDISARVQAGGSIGGGTAIRSPQNYQTARVPKMDFTYALTAGQYIEFFSSVTPNATTVSGEYATYAEMRRIAST